MNKVADIIKKKNSLLCVGLDASPIYWGQHIPNNVHGLEYFCKAVIDATEQYACSYKLNLAFFEVWGSQGWEVMERLLDFIPKDIFLIADAKRGDIGHSASFYAKTFFETYHFDGITVNPYMGKDAVEPFLEYQQKITFLLALTSNQGAEDFELVGNPPLYEQVLRKSAQWNLYNNIGFVMGATRPTEIQKLRNIHPKAPLLIPGIGAQEGDLKSTIANAYQKDVPSLITVSRAILYADTSVDYQSKIKNAAKYYQEQIKNFIDELSVS